jgi:hypothetical protein
MKITIPEPCTADWAAMAPGKKGLFCSHCRKDVIDFSQFTDEEIVDYFRQNLGKKVCGRFATNQLGRELKPAGLDEFILRGDRVYALEKSSPQRYVFGQPDFIRKLYGEDPLEELSQMPATRKVIRG